MCEDYSKCVNKLIRIYMMDASGFMIFMSLMSIGTSVISTEGKNLDPHNMLK